MPYASHKRPRARAKTVEHKRKWLISKLNCAKATYDEALAAFKQRLDDIVGENFRDAARVLEEQDEDLFLKEVYEVANAIEKCNDELFDLNLRCCSPDLDSTYEEESETERKDITMSPKNFSSPKCTSSRKSSPLMSKDCKPAEESNPVKKREESSASSNTSPTISFSSQSNSLSPVNIQTCNVLQPSSSSVVVNSIPCDSQTLQSSSAACFSQDSIVPACSGKFSSEAKSTKQEEPIVRGGLPTISENPSSCQITPNPVHHYPNQFVPNMNVFGQDIASQMIQISDVDLLILLNVRHGQKVDLLVTDVKDPSYFSVQPIECEDQLQELQRSINELYSKPWTSELLFKETLEVGTICVALFSIDKCWYRAKIMKKIKADKFGVLYIDYGNYSDVDLKDLRIIAPNFGNIPQMSIQCSLFGIEPAPCLGNTFDDDLTWTMDCIKWFDSQIYSKRFVGQFLDVPCNPGNNPVYSVHLFSESKILAGEEILSVADSLVCMGFCSYIENSSNVQRPGVNRKQVDYHDLIEKKPETSRSGPIHNAIPAGMENSLPGSMLSRKMTINLNEAKSIKKHQNRRKVEAPIRNPHAPSAVKPEVPSLMEVARQYRQNGWLASDNEVNDKFSNENLSTWNPMREDFSSQRNRYNINTDDACVAVENFDPSKVKTCKHFEKGRCWKGKNCDRPHVVPQKGVLYHTQVLSGHSLDHVELSSEEKVVVKVTTVPKNDDFYAQLISSNPKKFDTKTVKELTALTEDMKHYYSKNRSRLCFDGEICIGEMCVVLHDRNYCRAYVTKAPNNNERVQIHLVDYGNLIWIDSSKLWPLNQAFFHLPAQAVLCTYDKTTSAVPPVKMHCFLARVGNITPVVDSPIPLTLLAEI